MKYYAIYNNNTKELSKANCRCLNKECENIEISVDVFNSLEKYMYQENEIIINPDYETEQAQKREEEFKSQFFEIVGYGWYRRTPKGYGSAVESVNTAFNAVTIMGSLPAGSLTFYTQPDFTMVEQCTEEWLVAHQIKNEVMTSAEFGAFYTAFIQAWNTQEHQ